MAVKLERFSSNPLLTPTSNWWECAAVFNCGAVEYNGKIYLLYRAVGQDRASRFGLAISRDGVTIDERRPQPVFETDYNNPNEWCGCEDPRITPLDGQYYIAYTAVSLYPSNTIKYSNETPWRTRVALLQTSDFETFSRRGIIFSDEADDKDAALFPAKIDGRYFIFHRRNLAIVLASSSDLIQWKEEGTILKPDPSGWQSGRLGVGTPPIKTELGWLVIYHARDRNGVYRLGAFVVDFNDPCRVVARLADPLFEPEKDYERTGIVPNVVFTCGMVERNDSYLVYYGGGDRVIGGARIAKSLLLDALHKSKVV